MNRTFIIIFILLNAWTAQTQDMTQTVRGVIEDQDTKMPLIGATIQIQGSNPLVGTISDMEGNFRIENVPVGRISLKINFIGFEERIIPNLLITSAKEVVLQVPLIESVDNLEEVVVTAKKNKAEVLNEMSLVSARSFSVEETKRFAGSFADPARMVSAFAGVTNQPEGNNDIIVRGNSPRGILWRLEGIEIPNPNHFANEGATGGPINALNGNMLSDSDFMSGAFSPEYGNALSGVFDMKLKKGNNETREYTATASTLGLDFTAEGPFKKGYNGSYLANYRYSSLAIIDQLGVVDFGGVPKYQDLSFKINLPINPSHIISVFGLGGISSITAETKFEDEEEVLGKSVFGADMGVMGVTHNFLINERSFLKSSVSVSGTRLESNDDLPDENDGFYNAQNSDFKKSALRIATTFNHKFSAKHKLETGVIYTRLNYDMIEHSWNFERDRMETVLDDNGNSYTIQAFANWKYRITKDLTLSSGMHYMHFGLNDAYSVEPRAALKWAMTERQAFTVGVGLHSKVESLAVYLGKQEAADGSLSMPNENLGLSKAAHYVLGYDQSLGANTHLKLETYYQHLYDVPIENEPSSTYSLLNASDDFSNRVLNNDGTGKNYGVELTLEQYLHRGFYYMLTGSVYESKYTAMDGIERKTAFACNYAFNLLGGKEWKFGKAEKNRVLFVNTKVSLLGGKRYTPIDLAASQALGDEVRKEDQPFSARSSDIFIMNVAIGTRRNKKNTTREFKIDIQNISNNQAVVNQYYVHGNGKIMELKQLPLFPTISYTYSF
ncbi:MAG: TonB-dependent receptor [Reichenbachiella sp.]|uniref:TonB-dependent receptor n=1 Tax=Reichenbachiella sp. TaxID=2184521 RepID=UPI003298AD1C